MRRYVVVNRRTLQPGCVLIQAGMGGDRRLLDEHFDSTDWQVDGLADMVPIPEEHCATFADLRKRMREKGMEELPQPLFGEMAHA